MFLKPSLAIADEGFLLQTLSQKQLQGLVSAPKGAILEVTVQGVTSPWAESLKRDGKEGPYESHYIHSGSVKDSVQYHL